MREIREIAELTKSLTRFRGKVALNKYKAQNEAMKTLFIAATALLPLLACAAHKARGPASGAVPKCWRIYDPTLYDGLYHITIPANDALTAKNVQTMIQTLQAAGLKSHSVSSAGDSILLEAQFLTLDQGRNLGYPTQASLEEMVEFTLANDVPFLEKGVTISCFAEAQRKHH